MNWKNLFEYTSPESAIALQQNLSLLVLDNSPARFAPMILCGLDAAYADDRGIGVAAVWDLEKSSVVEVRHTTRKMNTDYMPGFLAFREGPLIVSAASMLRSRPDVFLVDGHGRAHPRRFGLACNVGLALDTPTIGVAKTRLYGTVQKEKLMGPDGAILGAVLRAEGNRTFYVSVGHKIGLGDALSVVERSLVQGHPAPLRIAHLEATRLRRKLQG